MGVAKQSIIITLLNWALLPLNILTSVLIARTLGPEGVGIFTLLIAAVSILSSLGGFGIADSFVYYYKKKNYSFGQLCTVPLLTSFLFTLLVLVSIFFFSEQFFHIFFQGLKDYNVNKLWIYLAFFTLPFSLIFGVLNLILIVDNHMKLYAIRQFGAKLANLLFISLLFVLGLRITGVLLSNLFIYIVPIVILGIWIKQNDLDFKPIFSKEVFKNLFYTGSRQYGVSLFAIITKRISVLFIAYFLAIEFNGYYAIAYGLMDLCLNIPRSTMWPLVGNLTGAGKEKQEQTIAQAMRILLLFMIIVALILCLISDYLIYYLYGENFLLSVNTFRFLLPALIASAVIIPGNAYYNSIGQPGRVLTFFIPITALYLIALFVLIPLIDIKGVAIAFSLKQIALGLIYIHLLSKHTDISVKKFLLFSKTDAKQMYELIETKFQTIKKK